MAILLDTDIFIQAGRGAFDLAEWLGSKPQEEFHLAAITVAELWRGVERAAGPQRARREHYLDEILPLFNVLPYTAKTAKIHARLASELDLRGRMIDAHELILAAHARETGAAIATFGRRNFSSVPGLEVITPA